MPCKFVSQYCLENNYKEKNGSVCVQHRCNRLLFYLNVFDLQWVDSTGAEASDTEVQLYIYFPLFQ